MLHPHDGILLCNINESTIGTRDNIDELQMLTERSQTQKTTYCMIALLWCQGKGKTLGTEIISVIVKVWSLGQGIIHKRHMRALLEWEKCSLPCL